MGRSRDQGSCDHTVTEDFVIVRKGKFEISEPREDNVEKQIRRLKKKL